ncbi:MAG: hypothetical protein PHF11_06255 [Candidatus Omnitrophica bacterium]|nr:hypothetical protein [Candidatus Omnitrophota bacterium]
MNKKQYNILWLLLSLCFCAGLCGCGRLRLESNWRGQPLIIDGKYSDWPGAASYYYESQKAVINLLNDSDYLYICLITRDRQLELRLMESGFTAWFDPADKRKKAFGIRFPVGLKRMGMSIEQDKRDMAADWRDQEDKTGLIDRERERLTDRDFEKRLQTIEELQDKLEVITGPFTEMDKGRMPEPPAPEDSDRQKIAGGPGSGREGFHKDRPGGLSLEEAAKLGIEAKVGRENGYFVYELKVPMIKSAEHPYAIETGPGRTIGLGLEIRTEPRYMPRAQDMDGYSGMGRGMIQEGNFQLWATVTLASGASAIE